MRASIEVLRAKQIFLQKFHFLSGGLFLNIFNTFN